MSWPIFDRIDWFNNEYRGVSGTVAGGVVDLTQAESNVFDIVTAVDNIKGGPSASAESAILPGAIPNTSQSAWGPSFFDSEGSGARSYLGFFMAAVPNLAARLMNLFDVIGDYLYVDSSFNRDTSSRIVERSQTITKASGRRVNVRYYINTVTFDRSIGPVMMTDLYGECKAVIDKCIGEVVDISSDVKAGMLSMSATVAAELCARRLLLNPEQMRFMLWEEYLGILSIAMDKLGWSLDASEKLVTVDASLDDVGSVISPSGLVSAATIFAIFKGRVNPTKYEVGDGVFVADADAVLNPVLTSDITVRVLDGDGDVLAYREGKADTLLDDNKYDIDPTTREVTVEYTLGKDRDPQNPISPSDGSGTPLNFEELEDEGSGVFILPDMNPINISEDLPPCPISCSAECGVVLRELGAAGQFHRLPGFKDSRDTLSPAPLDAKKTYEEFALLAKLKLDGDGIPKFESAGFSQMIDRHSSLVRKYLKEYDSSTDTFSESHAVYLPHLGFSGKCVVLLGYPRSTVISRSGFEIGPELYLTDITEDISGGITKNMGRTAVLPLDPKERQKYLDGELAYPPPYAFYTERGVNYKVSSYTQYAKREYGHAYNAYKVLKGMQPIPATEEKGNWWWLLVIGMALLMVIVGAIAYQNENSKKGVSGQGDAAVK